MSDFMNYFRSVGRNINGVFHKGEGRGYKPSGNPQRNFAREPPGYDEVFGRASRVPRTQDVNQDAHNVPVASRAYLASQQVTIPVSPADTNLRINAESCIYREQDDTTMETPPQSREVTPEPELHHLVDAIVAQSGAQPRIVTPELEVHHLEDAISAQSTPRVRVDTPHQTFHRLPGSNIDRDTRLQARIFSNQEVRDTVSRLPPALRSASLQERFGNPGQSTLPRVAFQANEFEYRHSGSDTVEPYSMQPRAVSAPQPALRSNIPVFVGTASSQQRATSQSSIPIANRVASSHQRVSRAHQPSPSREAFTTSARFPLMNGQDPAPSEQVASTRKRHCHNVVPEEFVIPNRSSPRVHGTPQEGSLSGDLHALKLNYPSERAGRPSFATHREITSRQATQSNGTSSNTVAGNTPSNALKNTHYNGIGRSSTSHHENHSGACCSTRSRRELAHSESIESMDVEMNTPTTEPITNFSRPRNSEPTTTSNFSLYQIQNEYLAEAYMRHTGGLTLAQRMEAERPRRGLPRSPGMYNLPTVNDEINHPIHPGDFHNDGYHPVDRDPGRHEERAPAPANRRAAGNLRQRRARNSYASRQRCAARHRAAIAREEALAKDNESKKRKRERQKCISKVLGQVSMNNCFCEDGYDDAGEPHEPVKMLNCRHIFGRSCITEWLMVHNTCPLCRSEVPLSP
ncbi:fdb562d6-a0eb-47b6-8661-8980853d799e-CDS [Sclerotinia trifoliorum]|uniref:Fdb562d6-a0eb-47b6-8661-8980853d799e-CDS n=1 Tax=Sclerotinia trifoliorum TaxID=28548 RepID=A0A8H2VYK3_9HELO|nr:fdb562d6-a0eb-47b6-8661-8980853d799e-CDS [Sclerotinia trifoliorum]